VQNPVFPDSGPVPAGVIAVWACPRDFAVFCQPCWVPFEYFTPHGSATDAPIAASPCPSALPAATILILAASKSQFPLDSHRFTWQHWGASIAFSEDIS
jgi:hypothetical protein